MCTVVWLIWLECINVLTVAKGKSTKAIQALRFEGLGYLTALEATSQTQRHTQHSQQHDPPHVLVMMSWLDAKVHRCRYTVGLSLSVSKEGYTTFILGHGHGATKTLVKIHVFQNRDVCLCVCEFCCVSLCVFPCISEKSSGDLDIKGLSSSSCGSCISWETQYCTWEENAVYKCIASPNRHSATKSF